MAKETDYLFLNNLWSCLDDEIRVAKDKWWGGGWSDTLFQCQELMMSPLKEQSVNQSINLSINWSSVKLCAENETAEAAEVTEFTC